MTPTLYVLCFEISTASDRALCKLAHFLGVQTQLILLGGNLTESPPALLTAASEWKILALGSLTLRQIFQLKWFADLLDESHFVFVYGFKPSDVESPELKWLTSGVLSSVIALGTESKQFAVASDVKFCGFPVSGRSYSVESVPAAAFSAMPPGSSIESYITVNGHPHFVGFARGRSVLFLLAEPELVDIDKVLSPDMPLQPWYAQLIAGTIFLRSAFGDWCWTSPFTTASLVIDDPYLKPKYGFLHYETLLRELRWMGGALTIAFIPNNYRRSNPQTIELLRSCSDLFSIGVHGCDHTRQEFASLDEASLVSTTSRALQRMESHKERTQMPFDNIMIFPQGKFSTKAIRALKACGFHAAANSTPWPVDYRENPLTLRDRLDVAMTRYECFPIFVRRYPRDVFDYAFDALFQKPVLAQEHHVFFRDGYKVLAKLVDEITSFGSNVQWMPLGRAVTSSCMFKRVGKNEFALRHFSQVFKFTNPTTANALFSVEKPEQEGLVEAVLLDGRKIPFEFDSNLLKYSVHLQPGNELNVTIVYGQRVRSSRSLSWMDHFTVMGRRAASEFRDNYLSRNNGMLVFVQNIMKLLRLRD